MFSPVVYCLAAFAALSMHDMIFPVKGQCTVQGCENRESSISIAEEIQKLLSESFRQQLNEHDQRIRGLLIESFQQIKSQLDTVVTSLQAVDRRSQEQDIYIKKVQTNNELINASVQQTRNQQDTILRNILTVDRRLQDQDQRIHELLNASSQQMTNQHDIAMRQLDLVIQLLLFHDNSIKNQTRNSRTLTIGVPLRPEIVIDLGDGPVLLPNINRWIVIMHRFDGSQNFTRNWSEYKNGFGDIGRGEFWLGNEIVHRLTNTSGVVYSLRIEVYANGTWFNADYASFSLDSENDKYVLRLSGYSGSAGDSLINPFLPSLGYHGGMSFSTYDADNDKCSTVCGLSYRAGWWFNCCDSSCLTCPFGGYHFNWYPLRNLTHNGKIRAARMMLRSNN